MDVIIIGGGASGMVAAITSKRLGNNVTIIEKNNTLGKKLLLTGNGRCNYFNDNMSLDNYYNEHGVSRFINNDNLNKVNIFFDSIGIIPRIKDGLYYPYSNTATSIQNSLVKEIEHLKINVVNEEVVDINKKDKFIIKTNNGIYECDKLIMSLGGSSYPKTGSDGLGFILLNKLGHNIIPIKPALVPLKTDENVKDWAGIRTNVKVDLYLGNKFINSQSGEAQLTDYGISGICVMNLSRFVDKNNTLVINFVPIIDDLYDFIEGRNNKLKDRTIIELLETIVNYKLLYFILKKIHINNDATWDSLNKEDKNKLVDSLTNYKLNIVGTKGLEFGETISGGVDLDEVTDKCESKKIPNLYITGELLNIDGICGGYNLTNAWISGILAGEDND
ncbi:MAG: aminoacetone oxidase family FAD-binding enzyme [Bacilli bacterium]|nr:aminoacetone oxidase family FAD-binding enzyme [Bacilli bacterium]